MAEKEKKRKKSTSSSKSKGQTKEKEAKKNGNTFILSAIREGRPLSVDFFKRHGWFIIISMVVVLALIGQRYSNKYKMREIKKLEKELRFEQSQQLSEKALYMSLIRENEMKKLLKEKNLDLGYQEQPPYELSKH